MEGILDAAGQRTVDRPAPFHKMRPRTTLVEANFLLERHASRVSAVRVSAIASPRSGQDPDKLLNHTLPEVQVAVTSGWPGDDSDSRSGPRR